MSDSAERIRAVIEHHFTEALGQALPVTPQGELTEDAKSSLIASFRHALRRIGFDVVGPIYVHFDMGTKVCHFSSQPDRLSEMLADNPRVRIEAIE